MIRQWLTVCVMTVAAALLLGCTVLPPAPVPDFRRVESPTAEVTGIAVTDRSNDGARVEVMVLVTNDNDFPLPLTASRYRVTVAGVGDFAFDDHPHVTLPANSSQPVTLPAAFAMSPDAGGGAVQVAGTFTYEPPGQFRKAMTDSGIPLPKVGFDGSGRLE